jgi:hypothetical protein
MRDAAAKTPTPAGLPSALLLRLLDEGHAPEPWHGAGFLVALEGVDAERAARRPGPGRHNIGELALHHAHWMHVVRGRLTGAALEPFVLEGEDWFDWPDESRVPWAKVCDVVETELARLRDTVQAIAAGLVKSPLTPEQQFDQVLGIAAHAVYHAGQVQLVKALV